jgi:hypothetical protein
MTDQLQTMQLNEGLGELLYRELFEIYLLMDYISSHCELCLPKTLDIDFNDATYGSNWVRKVCSIPWPPEGPESEVVKEAEFLVKTRDALNRLVRPATGASIAFTIMSVGDRGARKPGCDVSPRTGEETAEEAAQSKAEASGGGGATTKSTGSGNPRRTQPRLDLAYKAYPQLKAPAKSFALWNFGLLWGLGVCLIFTLLFSWYVALGSNLLNQAYSARVQFDAETKTGLSTSTPFVAANRTSTALYAAPDAGTDQRYWLFLCNRVVATRVSLSAWTDPKRWLPLSPSAALPCAIADNGAAATSSPAALGTPFFAVAWFNMLGASVLPAVYGLLGAWAAVVRRLSGRMEYSLLTDRDVMQSLIRLALGSVIGACIGLFMTPSANTDAKNAVGLLGTAFLGASALSFLAGFGVTQVFGLLDGVLSHLFTPSRLDPKQGADDASAGARKASTLYISQ